MRASGLQRHSVQNTVPESFLEVSIPVALFLSNGFKKIRDSKNTLQSNSQEEKVLPLYSNEELFGGRWSLTASCPKFYFPWYTFDCF